VIRSSFCKVHDMTQLICLKLNIFCCFSYLCTPNAISTSNQSLLVPLYKVMQELYDFFLERRQKLCRIFIRQKRQKKRYLQKITQRKISELLWPESQQLRRTAQLNRPYKQLIQENQKERQHRSCHKQPKKLSLPIDNGWCCQLKLLNIILAYIESDLSWL
jgi:hypothetical protein